MTAPHTLSVYLPLCVDVAVKANGSMAVVGAHVDFDGAPWMFVDREPNVWDDAAEEWRRGYTDDDQTEASAADATASAWLAGLISRDS